MVFFQSDFEECAVECVRVSKTYFVDRLLTALANIYLLFVNLSFLPRINKVITTLFLFKKYEISKDTIGWSEIPKLLTFPQCILYDF